jgi:hypothetical protein
MKTETEDIASPENQPGVFGIQEMVAFLVIESNEDPLRLTGMVSAWVSAMHYIVLERIKKDRTYLDLLREGNQYIYLSRQLNPDELSLAEMVGILSHSSELDGWWVKFLCTTYVAQKLGELAEEETVFEPLGKIARYENGFSILLPPDFLEPTCDEPQLILPDEYVGLLED